MSFRPLGRLAIEKIGCQPFCNVIANKSKEEKCDIYEDNYYELQLVKQERDKLEKITALLKEKKVDIGCLEECIEASKTKSIKSIMSDYNYNQSYWALDNYLNMKQTQLLVDWLKEEQINE